MTATAEPPASATQARAALRLGEGVELLGPVHGCGYRDGASLVRRGDGQMLQLGPLMYTLLECVDGSRDTAELAGAVAEKLERRVDHEHVVRIAQKLGRQGLLAGTEHRAPPRRNPLLALRWKVVVTDPKVTNRLTAPLTFLFRPWLMWPILAAFVAVFWFVLIHKGVASATAQAFRSPGLLLLVFVLAVISAGVHELGHAAACRYGGATPGAMGMGLYLVWPAFYTDVTDTYRLPQRDRLRVDFAGLYFNAAIAVITLAVWLVWRVDALLLLVALQVLQMVKQLSPVIRADGYHILSDATGVPDLYSHMGPTLRRLLPGHRQEPAALTGRARLLVTLWVLIIIPVLLSLMLGAILLLPRLATSAWDDGRLIINAIPQQADHGQILDLLASVLRLLALILPVLGSALVTQRIVRTVVMKGRSWSRGSPPRMTILTVGAAAAVAAMVWAWWPSGQYRPVRANQGGTLGSLVSMVTSPATVARPNAAAPQARLRPGTHLALSIIPVGGATRTHPAMFVVSQGAGKPAVAIVSTSTPSPAGASSAPAASTAPSASDATAPSGSARPGTTSAVGDPTGTPATKPGHPVAAAAFPFTLPSAPGPNDSQAVAVGDKNGGVTYDVAYSLVTVTNGAPVTETNSAYALADCNSCTTVAVSFQIVLIVGQSNDIAPINAAEALNDNCPACVTTALADQIIVTLKSAPSKALLATLDADLRRLNALPALGANGTPSAVAAEVAAVQQEVNTQLQNSGLLANSTTSTTSSTTPASTSTTTPTATTSTTTPTATAPAEPTSTSSTASPTPTTPTTSTTTSTTTTQTQTSTTPTTTTPTTTTPTTTTPTTTPTSTTTTSSSG